MDALESLAENVPNAGEPAVERPRFGLWKLARIILIGAVGVGLLLVSGFVVFAGIAIAEGQGERFVRAAVGAVVSFTLVWLLCQAARYAGRSGSVTVGDTESVANAAGSPSSPHAESVTAPPCRP